MTNFRVLIIVASLFLFCSQAYADYDSVVREANSVHDQGKIIESYNLYKKAYKQAITRKQVIQSFASLATTAKELGYKKSSGSYIDRLRTISPRNKWAKRFVNTHDIEISGGVIALNDETYTDLMLAGDQSYKSEKYKSAYVYYLKGLSMASSREELIVSLASLAVASHKNSNDNEAVIYLKRLNYISPENQWAKNFANKIGAKNTDKLTKTEYKTLVTNDKKYTSYKRVKSCGKKPTLACSPQEANDISFAMCATVMGGCEIVQKDLSRSNHYLADQACNALVNEMTYQKQELDSMLVTFVGTSISEAASSARRSDDGFTKFIFGTALTIMDLSFKATIFDQCRAAARQSCRTAYNNWQYSCN